MGTLTEQGFTPEQSPNLATDAERASYHDAGKQFAGKKRGLLGRGWRKITWLIIGWSTLVVVGGLAISGHTANKLTSSCQNTLDAGSLCQQVGSQTATDQFEHIMKIGLVGFAVLSVIWFMTRPQN
jgi:hypothetical protein